MFTTPKFTQTQLEVSTLGERRYKSPLNMSITPGDGLGDYVWDDARILYEPRRRAGQAPCPLELELAGPRENIFFDPLKSKAAIVSCGGLCPGINNVIRALVFELSYNYGVPEILGIRYGYSGLNPEVAVPPLQLTPQCVEDIHMHGGTILGTSRGPQEPGVMVDYMLSQGVNMLFCIGGDGTHRGTHAIAEEIARRGAPISTVGIPKTIDNDISFCSSTFGFFSAVSEAETVIDRAHVEAKSVQNGVGLVKLMGREAGFLAATATLASGEANFCMIPEAPFHLEGNSGFLARLKRRLQARQHAVVVVAEGAGQSHFQDAPGETQKVDASGNRKLEDIGVYLKGRIESYFKSEKVPVTVKYFDPSYHIRSVAAAAIDSLLCESFGRAAAHAALAGKTDVLIGYWQSHLVHVPLATVTAGVKRVDPESELWTSVLALTGQEKW